MFLSERHLDVGVSAVERRQETGQVDVRDTGDRSQADVSADDAAEVVDRVAAGSGGVEGAFGVG